MVDRVARDQMVAAIERYLDEEVSLSQLDDALHNIAETTQDETARYVADLFLDDDPWPSRKCEVTKDGWDFCQRVLLLLKSDGRVQIDEEKKWTLRNALAAALFALYLLALIPTGLWEVWVFIGIPFGIPAGLIAFWRYCSRPSVQDVPEVCFPFSSVRELLRVHRRIPSFVKRRFPKPLENQKRKDPIAAWLIGLPIMVVVWLISAPLILLFLACREYHSTVRIVVD